MKRKELLELMKDVFNRVSFFIIIFRVWEKIILIKIDLNSALVTPFISSYYTDFVVVSHNNFCGLLVELDQWGPCVLEYQTLESVFPEGGGGTQLH